MTFLVILWLALSIISLSVSGGSTKCSIKFDISICSSNATQTIDNDKCRKDIPVCTKNFSISHVKIDPYSIAVVAGVVQRCCGICTNILHINTLKDVTEIPDPSNNSADLIFPVLGRSSATEIYGYHFIPLIEPPSLHYVTLKDTHILQRLVMHCLNMWPLLLTCFFLIAVSGFITWLIETRSNPDEFPASFFPGWLNGCWWSFISLTTVGYGDKIPRTGLGRLFSAFCILIGITSFSLITAMLASELTVTSSEGQPPMSGRQIGVLKHRTYDTIAIASHGGTVRSSLRNGKEGVEELLSMLKMKQIDGFVIDRFTLTIFCKHMENLPSYENDLSLFRSETVKSEVSYKGEKLSYGVLVKEAEDYNYLADFVRDNQQVINACNNLILNEHIRDIILAGPEFPLFSTKGVMFLPTIITGFSAMAIVLCFGVAYEWYRTKGKHFGKRMTIAL